ncbi:CPBP family intramembrane metalloprotease [bacterium]|nr:CPBP family intramembrane metalloprotease [bacterium]
MKKAAAERAEATSPSVPSIAAYLNDSRDFATGFLFIVPLLLVYEVGVRLLRSDVINWAHGTVRLVFHVFGPWEPALFGLVVGVLVAVAIWRTERPHWDLDLYGMMLVESIAYACAMGLVCSHLARRLLPLGTMGASPGLAQDLVLSAGAGVYEEVLFRVILLGAIYHALKRWLRLHAGLAAFVAITFSSVAFAACHHLGPYGDPVEVGRLAYRFGLGILFAAIYVYRGLGIVVYTHTLYDVFVSLNR